MYRVMGLINLHEAAALDVLTDIRPLAAVPFGGKYRLIDFVLSNLVNAGIYSVGILIPEDAGSLVKHMRAGKEWDLDRKRDGMQLLLPLKRTALAGTGDIDYYSQHLEYIMQSNFEHVIISGSQFLCNIDYKQVFTHHLKTNADITFIYRKMQSTEARPQGAVMLDFDKNNLVNDMQIDPPVSDSQNLYMRMAIVKKQLLIDIITHAMSRGGGDFIRQLQARVDKMKITGWQFNGYVANIASVKEYYQHSLELLNTKAWQDLFFRHGHIYTRIKDSVPTKYLANSSVINSLLANSCKIDGKVENSIIFRSVNINKNAKIKNSIIMQDCTIGEKVVLENVICDKDVTITAGTVLKGDKSYPLVIKKGTVV